MALKIIAIIAAAFAGIFCTYVGVKNHNGLCVGMGAFNFGLLAFNIFALVSYLNT